jgi:flagellar protein FlgJ
MSYTIDTTYQLQQYENIMKKLKTKAKNIPAASKEKAVDKNSKLYEVCREFEAIFIKQMLNVMRKTVVKNELFHGGFVEEIFEDMLYDDYAKKMAHNGHFGLSDMLYKQLNKDEMNNS